MKRILQLLLLACLAHSTIGQTLKDPIITADSLAGGNYKDVFVSFFKLATEDLTGPQKSFNFISNPYVLMKKANPAIAIDTNYRKCAYLRNFNFNIGVGVDSSFKITTFSAGVKYAIINKRDHTNSTEFTKLYMNNAIASQVATLQNDFIVFAQKNYPVSALPTIVSSFNNWVSSVGTPYSQLDTATQRIVTLLIAKDNLNLLKNALAANNNMSAYAYQKSNAYDSLVTEWQKKPLWTVGGYVYLNPNSANNKLSVNNAYFNTEFLWAFNKTTSPVRMELNIIASDSINNYVPSATESFTRNVFSIEPGINFSFRSVVTKMAFFEFKLSGTYAYVIDNPLPQENRSVSTINGTARLRLINDIWLPLTFKMDDKGRFYGNMGLRFNFSSIASLLGKG